MIRIQGYITEFSDEINQYLSTKMRQLAVKLSDRYPLYEALDFCNEGWVAYKNAWNDYTPEDSGHSTAKRFFLKRISTGMIDFIRRNEGRADGLK